MIIIIKKIKLYIHTITYHDVIEHCFISYLKLYNHKMIYHLFVYKFYVLFVYIILLIKKIKVMSYCKFIINDTRKGFVINF